MKNNEERIRYEWFDTGTLEIVTDNNLSATLRFFPSKEVILETLQKLSKTSGNKISEDDDLIPFIGEESKIRSFLSTLAPSSTEYDSDKLNDCYKKLSIMSHNFLKLGRLYEYAITLEIMAEILKLEQKFVDEIKLIMLAFYIRLNCGYEQEAIFSKSIVEAMVAYGKSGMTETELKELYYETVREDVTPTRKITVDGSYKVFRYCIKGNMKSAELIVSNLKKNID